MSKDMFAKIADNAIEKSRQLYTPEPEILPEIFLPNEQHQVESSFVAPQTMCSQEELDSELVSMRKKYAQFLEIFTPILPSRPCVEIAQFDWRLEKGQERSSGLADALNGNGEWQTVTIPHYEGPIGRACASYRTVFFAKKPKKTESIWLCFGGVDYRCEVYVNGLYAGSHEGFFEAFEFDVGDLLQDGENTLLVRVMNEAPGTGIRTSGTGFTTPGMEKYDGDKLYACTGLGWDDPALGWHHCPPGMGIHGKVKIETRPRIFFKDVFVRPLEDLKHVEIMIELYNVDYLKLEKGKIRFSLRFYGLNYKAKLAEMEFIPDDWTAGKESRYRITAELPNVRIWSPDAPWMEEVQITLQDGESFSRRFGMRSFTQDLEHKPYGRFYLNGSSIRLRGANTMGFEQQDVQRGDFDQLRDDILLAKIANLNFWRITQRPVQPEVYDYCDRLGLMVQCDFPLFGMFPRWQFAEALRQSGAMERLIRNHPSVVLVTMINEPYRPYMVPYSRFLIREELEKFFRASGEVIHIENPDRVIKPVDGDYDPPAPNICDLHCYNLWYNGHMIDYGRFLRGYWAPSKPDWCLGCGEYGIEGLDSVDLMRRRYPTEWLPKPGEKAWNPSRIVGSQTNEFYGKFFETPNSLEEWVAVSQEHQRWGVKTMTRVFRRDNRFVTMAVHLFIDAWPSGWMKSVMDCERHAKPAFFALKDALEPLTADIRSDRNKFYSGEFMRYEFRILNDSHRIPEGAKLRWQFMLEEKCVFAQAVPAKIEEDRSTFQGYFSIRTPDVTKRTHGRIEVVLEYDGALHGYDSFDLQVFPVPSAFRKQIVPIGDSAVALLQELGTEPAQSGNYLISNFDSYLARKNEIDTAVAKGAKAVFYNLPKHPFSIAGTEIQIEDYSTSLRQFAERVPGSPLLEGFEVGDFEHWYDPEKDFIVPLADSGFQNETFTPVLWTVSNNENSKQTHAMLAGSKGGWILTTLRFNGLLKSNPTARALLERLL